MKNLPMKKLLLTACIAFTCSLALAQGQNIPYIGTATIIPQNPGPNDNIKIVTNVTTPSQGIFVGQSHNVNTALKEINVRGCYTNGMLPATETYIDTFTIGQLPSGVYSIKHRAYISSSQLVCVKTADSNMVVLTLTVSGTTTGIKQYTKNSVQIFPNPAKEYVQLKNVAQPLNVQIYSASGSVVKSMMVEPASDINLKDLSAGLYFIRFRNEGQNEIHKFVKLD